MRAANTAFQMLPEIFQPVDMTVSVDVFPDAVVNGGMLVTDLGQVLIGRKLVGINRGALADIFLNSWSIPKTTALLTRERPFAAGPLRCPPT